MILVQLYDVPMGVFRRDLGVIDLVRLFTFLLFVYLFKTELPATFKRDPLPIDNHVL